MKKNIFSAMMGSLVEFYDFSIYSYSAIIIAPLFFPNTNSIFAIIQSYMIFAAGNLSRPLGALVFGFLGDKYGRKKTLEITILGIALPTFVIGILPTFEVVGYIAPLLLLFCRLIQGVFVGGEADGVAIYIQENTRDDQACFANSLNRTTSSCGILIGALFVWLCNIESMPDWGWRIPFFVGGLLGLITFWLRRNISESKDFKKLKKSPQFNSPQKFSEIVSSNWSKILIVVAICGAHGGVYNFFYVFLFNYLSDITHIIDKNVAELWKSSALFVYVLFAPLTGILADRVGLEKTLRYCIYTIFLSILLYVLFLDIHKINIYWVLLSSFWVTLFLAPGYVLLLRLFDVSIRYRCVSIGHTIGSALFSGTAPAVSTYIWHVSGESLSGPLYYFVALVTLMGVGLFFVMKNQTKNSQQIRFSQKKSFGIEPKPSEVQTALPS